MTVEMNRAEDRGGRASGIASCLVVSLAFALLLASVLIVSSIMVWRSFRDSPMGDWATKPPSRAFEWVFGRPVPLGVSGIRASGQVSIGGRDVWLRFSATDEALRSLTHACQRISDRDGMESCRMEWRLGEAAPRQIHWGAVRRIRNPECYSLPPKAPAILPDITLVVDRRHHLVYVHLFDI
jgi:hypothetical protein